MPFFIILSCTHLIFFYYFSRLILENDLIPSFFFFLILMNIFNENYLEPIPIVNEAEVKSGSQRNMKEK